MSSRYVYGIAAVLALTAVYACWCRAPMIWDGAYQFNTTLIMQHPYSYLTRFHSYLLWWPTVWASRMTSNVTLLQSIYGLPFLAAPVLGLLLSWWVLRNDAPQLIIWVIFGVAIATLPGQIFVINDSIFQQHLFWPLFAGLFVPLSGVKKAVLALLAAFQFVHPLGIALFLGASLAALALAVADTENRRRALTGAGVMFSLCVLAAAKVYITSRIPGLRDNFAEQEASWRTAMDRWDAGVRGWPLRGLWCMWIAGAAVVAHWLFIQAGKRPTARRAAWLAAGAFSAGAMCWLYWAHDGRLWWKALDYRRWLGPLTAPFFLFATIEACFMARSKNRSLAAGSLPASALRQRLGLCLALLFALVLGIQCTVWHRMSKRLFAEVEQYPADIVPESSLPWTAGTPLDHWGISDYVMVMQGKQPHKLLLDSRAEMRIYAHPPRIPHWDFYPYASRSAPDPTPSPAGWFDLRPLLSRLGPAPSRLNRGPERLDIESTPD